MSFSKLLIYVGFVKSSFLLQVQGLYFACLQVRNENEYASL